MYNILPHLRFTQFFLLIAFIVVLKFHSRKNKHTILVLMILAVSLFIEIATLIYIANGWNFELLYSVNAIVHNGLWLYILMNFLNKRFFLKLILPMYFVFAIINLLFIQGIVKFNTYTFIISALLYLIIFFNKSLMELKRENLVFFTSNNYILLFSPVIFFIGISFSISYNKPISLIKIFGEYDLYDCINLFSNLIYYLLLIIYITRENKSNYAS